MGTPSCSGNSIVYNETLCACIPGYILNQTTNSCLFFNRSSYIYTNSVDDFVVSFPETLFSFDSIKRFTQSQAMFLETTVILVMCWLLFCFSLRLPKIGDRGNRIFKTRWWLSRLDISYSTKHWLDDQKPVMKRKTELGGTFSIASWILFLGLFSASLYQIISKRTIEVHNVRALSAPDLASFQNYMEFNITTLSSMSCSNLIGLGKMVTGIIDQRQIDLALTFNYSCHNSTTGPTLNFKCSKCQFISDSMFISWQFVDLASTPATAVGFQFNFSSSDHTNKKHKSVVGGILKNSSSSIENPVTFRGNDSNIIKFNMFPQIYHSLNDLKLIQPVFHEFVPGSFVHEADKLRANLESPANGLINVTFCINLLSAYLVEIDKKSIMGPVSFLADVGGLYCFSAGIFFFLLTQFENRVKKLRDEDTSLRRIKNRRKAIANWDKLRKYVAYTWSCSSLNILPANSAKDSSCFSAAHPVVKRKGSSLKNRRQRKKDSINLKEFSLANRRTSKEGLDDILTDYSIPPPPRIDVPQDLSDVHKNLQQMFHYNVMLRDKLVAMETQLHRLNHSDKCSS